MSIFVWKKTKLSYSLNFKQRLLRVKSKKKEYMMSEDDGANII